MLNDQKHMFKSDQIPITKYSRLCDFNKKIYFLTVLEAECPRSGRRYSWSLCTSIFADSCYELTWSFILEFQWQEVSLSLITKQSLC